MKIKTSRLKIVIPDPAKYETDTKINSHLSFAPYYKTLKKRIQNPDEQFLEFYQQIIVRLEENPELLEPLTDLDIIEKHEELFQQIAATLFPFSTDKDLQYYALGSPYKFEFFFYSDSFAKYFNPNEKGYITFPPERPFEQIKYEYRLLAYRSIFWKFFGIELKGPERRINKWLDTNTGLYRYSRIHVDESFIDVNLLGELPAMPPGLVEPATGLIMDLNLLVQTFPLSLFSFEGFIIRRSIADVTIEECVKEVKNALIEMQSENPDAGYQKLKSAVETMIGSKNVEVSLSPTLRLNEKFVYYHKYSGKSILLRQIDSPQEKETAYQQLASLLSQEKKPLAVSDLGASVLNQKSFPLAAYFKKSSISSYVVVPLFQNNELIGMMEVSSPSAGVLNDDTMKKLEPVNPFFEMACRNDITQFKNAVGSIILERYTALLPVVEWKFQEEAWRYLKEKETQPSREIGSVSFDQVFPVYGAIDIKDSSNIRSQCFQKDILDQLDLVEATITELRHNPESPDKEILDKILEKIYYFRQKIEYRILAEDAEKVNEFLELWLKPFFRELLDQKSGNEASLRQYLESADPASGHLNKNRRAFEESIGKINSAISRYLESEQDKIQLFYPHYFEKFRTDGVEYNIFIGESFTPHKPFDYLDLKKVRLWQLSVMAEITRFTHQLAKEIPIPLQTTQLVLVYNKPICISFRKDERRFDVEGPESIQFEILKKRIDKVKIKNTGERLTRPGTIAIVYSHSSEVADYDEYFQILRKNNLLSDEIEMLELEDVQSISGLKAIRIKVKIH